MIEKYFASANGYSGFRSYFDEVFSESDLDKLFILKGGPGTGKSTFMKRIAEDFSQRVDKCELILCSSDKDSLDGVILYSKRGRVAIVDGTAPHLLDTHFPGAVSEIVNLGEGWDSAALFACRDEIKELTKRKAEAYRKAYDTLSVAGRIADRNLTICKDHFDKKRAEKAARILLSGNEVYEERPRTRLLSSFGKSGCFSLPASDKYEKINICGRHGSAELYLSLIADILTESSFAEIVVPAALDGRIRSGLLTKSRAYIIADEGISAEEFLIKFTAEEKEESAMLEALHVKALAIAAVHFSHASEYHFKLEEIYSSYMNYTLNEEKLEWVRSLIQRWLGF